MGNHGYMPSQRRRNLVVGKCFDYVRRYHPEVLRLFRMEAERVCPPVKGGRYKNMNTEEFFCMTCGAVSLDTAGRCEKCGSDQVGPILPSKVEEPHAGA